MQRVLAVELVDVPHRRVEMLPRVPEAAVVAVPSSGWIRQPLLLPISLLAQVATAVPPVVIAAVVAAIPHGLTARTRLLRTVAEAVLAKVIQVYQQLQVVVPAVPAVVVVPVVVMLTPAETPARQVLCCPKILFAGVMGEALRAMAAALMPQTILRPLPEIMVTTTAVAAAAHRRGKAIAPKLVVMVPTV